MKYIDIRKQIDDSQIARISQIVGNGRSSIAKLSDGTALLKTARIVDNICLGDYRRPNGEIVSERQMQQSPAYILGYRGAYSIDFPGEQLEPIRVNLLKVEITQFDPKYRYEPGSGNPGGH